MFRIISLLLIGLYSITNFAQNKSNYPYELNLKKDLIIGGLGTAILLSESIVGKQSYNDDENYFKSLNRNDVFRLDRFATDNWNTTAENTRETLGDVGVWGIGLGGSLALAALHGIKNNDKVGKNIFITTTMFFEGGLYVLGLSGLSKAIIKRNRPFAYNKKLSYDTKIKDEDYKESFFSGNTAITAYGVFFTAKLINDLYPNSNWKYIGWGTAGLYSAFTGYLAVKSGHHFPTDSFIGLAVGAGTALLIPHLHKKINNSQALVINPNLNGLSVRYKF